MEILGGIIGEELDVLVGLTQDREEEVGDQIVHVRLQVNPHRLGLHAFVQEGEGEREARFAEPDRFGDPLLDLRQVDLEDLRGEIENEALGESSVLIVVAIVEGTWITIPEGTRRQCPERERDGQRGIANSPYEKSIEIRIGPLLRFPPVI